MFRFSALSDADLGAEYAIFNQEILDLLRYHGPAACDLPTYQRLSAILSTIQTEQQRRAELAARQTQAA